MKTLVLLILLNQPDGSQREIRIDGLTDLECLAKQAEIWDTPTATVGYDAMGAIPAIDAACVPLAQLEGRK